MNASSAEPDEKATILIVDDQPENLAVLSSVLQPYYRVRAARSGEQALRAAATEPKPALVLLDVMMPEMDGYTVLRRLRENPATGDMPVVFVTALDADENEKKGFDEGAADYITKPIRPEIVLARVRTQLELKQARDNLADQNAMLEIKVAERTKALKIMLDKIEAVNASLKQNYLGTLLAISAISDLRSPLIGEHARNVAELSRQVAAQMGMDPAEMQDVFVAALLHDIGEIGFPDELLSKPLTAMNHAELERYRQHPVIGANALKKIESLSGIAEIVRHHHEHYDGAGFPDGLSGLDIPLGARIIAAVSDYDSLRHGLQTGQPMSSKQSCQYLIEARGGRYDPMVLDKLEPILAREGQFEIDEISVTAPHLHEGMLLTRDVLHPDGFLLLSKSTVMTRSLIDQLVGVEKQAGSPLKIFVLRESVQGRL